MTIAVVHNLRAWRRAVALERDQDVDDAFEPSSRWGVRPSVSILVAAWNEAPLIERHLASFARLTYSDLQMVICAGGTDGTYAIASRFGGDRLIVLEQRSGEGKQSALRRCLAAATGQVIVLTDADCLITEDQLERLIEPILVGPPASRPAFTSRCQNSAMSHSSFSNGLASRVRDPEHLDPHRVFSGRTARWSVRRSTPAERSTREPRREPTTFWDTP